MFEGLVASIFNKWLGKYVEDLDTEHLNVGIFGGEVRLNNLNLKPEALVNKNLKLLLYFLGPPLPYSSLGLPKGKPNFIFVVF